jgi:[ribosomal protein S18]-alanine N-acetyltransferase
MSVGVLESVACRGMTADDLDRVTAIEQAVHAHPWTRVNFADSLAAGYCCRVVEREGEIVAYSVLMEGPEEAHLLNLSVAANWQRSGIGSGLARHCFELARAGGAQRILLEVRPSNFSARALYARLGFVEIARRRGYYPAHPGREDALVLERTIA